MVNIEQHVLHGCMNYAFLRRIPTWCETFGTGDRKADGIVRNCVSKAKFELLHFNSAKIHIGLYLQYSQYICYYWCLLGRYFHGHFVQERQALRIK